MTPPRPAHEVLDVEFLNIRACLLDLAASLDRICRAEGSVADDARWQQIRDAIAVLEDDATSQRAKQLQLLFSLPYQSSWRVSFDMPSDR